MLLNTTPAGKERGAATDGLPLFIFLHEFQAFHQLAHSSAPWPRAIAPHFQTRETPISLPSEVTALGIIALYNQKTKIFGQCVNK